MGVDHALNFTGEDIESGHDDQILGAIDDEQVTVIIDDPDVARSQPAIVRLDTPSCFVIIEIAGKHIWSTYPNLTRVTCENVFTIFIHDAQLNTSHRHANTSGNPLRVKRAGDNRRGLGEAVSLADLQAEAIVERMSGLFRQF